MLQVSDKHDMVQYYSSNEISREPVLLGLNKEARTELRLSPYL